MKAGEIWFLSIINGKKHFVIPIYQRTYSWTYEQCQQLWDDIVQVAIISFASRLRSTGKRMMHRRYDTFLCGKASQGRGKPSYSFSPNILGDWRKPNKTRAGASPACSFSPTYPGRPGRPGQGQAQPVPYYEALAQPRIGYGLGLPLPWSFASRTGYGLGLPLPCHVAPPPTLE